MNIFMKRASLSLLSAFMILSLFILPVHASEIDKSYSTQMTLDGEGNAIVNLVDKGYVTDASKVSITANEAYTLDNGVLYFAPNASGTVVAKYTYIDSNGDQENVTLTASASTFIDFGPVNTASTLLNLSEYFIYSTESYMNYENCVNAMYKYTANITYTKLLNAAVEATKKAYADLQPGPSNVIKVIDNDWKGHPSSDYTPESFADFTVKLNAIKADINKSGVTLDDLRNDYKAYLSISSILKETLMLV